MELYCKGGLEPSLLPEFLSTKLILNRANLDTSSDGVSYDKGNKAYESDEHRVLQIHQCCHHKKGISNAQNTFSMLSVKLSPSIAGVAESEEAGGVPELPPPPLNSANKRENKCSNI